MNALVSETALRELHRDGHPLSYIFYIAYSKNRWGRSRVREILFGRAR